MWVKESSDDRSDVEQLDHKIKEAQTLCDELSVLIGEQYLKDELKKRLETVALPLQGLEDLAGEGYTAAIISGKPNGGVD